MQTVRRKCVAMLASAGLLVHMTALAQERPAGYPARPIRIVSSVPPGAGVCAPAAKVNAATAMPKSTFMLCSLLVGLWALVSLT